MNIDGITELIKQTATNTEPIKYRGIITVVGSEEEVAVFMDHVFNSKPNIHKYNKLLQGE